MKDMVRASSVAALLLATLASLLSSPAAAFEIRTTSSGQPIRWAGGEIVLQLGLGNGPQDVTREQAEAAARAAAASWQDALQGSAVSLTVGAGGTQAAPGDGVASVRWAMDADDPGLDVGLLAVTQVSYRIADGAIQDADVVVNAAEFGWTVAPSDCTADYDLESTLAHEIGHLLGLGHPTDHPEATMFATGSECETLKRDLADDDIAGVAHLYHELAAPGGPVAPAACSAAGEATALSALLVLAALALVRRSKLAIIAIAFASAFATPARAAELRLVELAELGRHADLVVRGTVVTTRPAPGPELATDSELRVSECFTAACPETIRVRRRGGEQGGRGLWVDGEAELEAGEEVILYLRARPDGAFRVVGGVQGRLRVARQAGVTYGVRDLRGHRVRAASGWRPGRVTRVELDEVRRSVAHLITPSER